MKQAKSIIIISSILNEEVIDFNKVEKFLKENSLENLSIDLVDRRLEQVLLDHLLIRSSNNLSENVEEFIDLSFKSLNRKADERSMISLLCNLRKNNLLNISDLKLDLLAKLICSFLRDRVTNNFVFKFEKQSSVYYRNQQVYTKYLY